MGNNIGFKFNDQQNVKKSNVEMITTDNVEEFDINELKEKLNNCQNNNLSFKYSIYSAILSVPFGVFFSTFLLNFKKL